MPSPSRTTRAILGALTLALVAGACSDVAAPRGAATGTHRLVAARLAPSGAHGELLGVTQTTSGDTSVTSLLVDPTTPTTLRLASGNAIVFPANAICDPATSGYGPGTWDLPCEPLTQKLTITAKLWKDPATGNPRVDVSPSLRFRPTNLGSVAVYFADSTHAFGAQNTILYCPSGAPDGSSCVNESLFDASIATQYDPTTGYLFRPIKHFSGYLVAVGFTGDTAGVSLGL